MRRKVVDLRSFIESGGVSIWGSLLIACDANLGGSGGDGDGDGDEIIHSSHMFTPPQNAS